MIEDPIPAVRRPAPNPIPRNMVLSFSADRPVNTEAGRVPAARLRPGDTMLSGGKTGLKVLSVSFCAGDDAAGTGQFVRILAGRAESQCAMPAAIPVVGHVSPQDGRLHLRTSPWKGGGQGTLAH